MKLKLVILAVALVALRFGTAPANNVTQVTLFVDECGNALVREPGLEDLFLPGIGQLLPDPSGGLGVDNDGDVLPALVYGIPGIPTNFGDVGIFEPGTEPGTEVLSDLVRFWPVDPTGANEGFYLIFYSDNSDVDPFPVLADTGFPQQGNIVVRIFEDANGIATYTPGLTQPGYLLLQDTVGEVPVSYVFMSDQCLTTIPEPASMLGLVLGVGAAFVRKRRML